MTYNYYRLAWLGQSTIGRYIGLYRVSCDLPEAEVSERKCMRSALRCFRLYSCQLTNIRCYYCLLQLPLCVVVRLELSKGWVMGIVGERLRSNRPPRVQNWQNTKNHGTESINGS